MAKKGKTERPAVYKPKSPKEARARLRALTKQIKKHLDDHEAHETLADAQLLRWFAGAAATYLSKKNKEKKKSLEQLLGLKAGPGRPSKPGRHFGVAYEMFLLRSTKSPTRKSKKGGSTPRPWKEVGKPYGLDGKSARKMVEREFPNIKLVLAKKNRQKSRRTPPTSPKTNSPRVEAIRFNSPQNARHFVGDLSDRLKMEIVILSSLPLARCRCNSYGARAWPDGEANVPTCFLRHE